MPTHALTISTASLGIGVIAGARVRIEQQRALVADTYPPAPILDFKQLATDANGVVEFLLLPDDDGTYHTIKIYNTNGILVLSRPFYMPPQAASMENLPEQDIVSASAKQAKEAAETALVARDEVVVARDEVVVARDEVVVARDEVVVARDEVVVARDEVVVATITAELARDAALVAADIASSAGNVWPTTASGIGNGISGITGLVGGSGGTNGQFSLSFSGGTQVIAPQGHFVVAGGAVVLVVITYPGYYSAGTPALSFAASSGLTGASATAIMSANTAVGAYFSVPHASPNNNLLDLYRVDTGPAATYITSYPSSDVVRVLSSSMSYLLSRDRRRAGSAYPFSIVFAGDDRCALGVERDGKWRASAFKPWNFGVNRRGGGALRYTLVMDEDGRQLLYHDADGLVCFEPSPDLIGKLQQSAIYPLSDARGDYPISNLRKTDTYYVAQVQDRGGNVYDARQLKLGSYDTFVLDRAQEIEGEGTLGQSNAGGTGTGPTAGTKIADGQWPFSVLSFNARNFQQGSNGAVDGSTLTDLIPLKDAVSIYSGQFPATVCAFAWAQRQADAGLLDVGRICWTAYQGDQPAASFLPGTVNWNNYMTFATRAKVMAELYGREIVFRRVRYIQGEAAANWQTDFTTIANAIGPALQAISGQSDPVRIMLWQIVGVSPDNGVGQLQHSIALSRSDCDLVAMMYAGPVSDVQHLTAEGRMMMADAESEYRKQVALGKTWTHMRMQSANRSGNVVTITVALPPGVDAASKCTDYPPQITQDGFVYRDSGGDTAISSIAYAGDTITLTLASTPAGSSPVVRYGLDNGCGISGWAALGGNVCGETRTVSDFYLQGYSVPPFIRHYLARQSQSVS